MSVTREERTPPEQEADLVGMRVSVCPHSQQNIAHPAMKLCQLWGRENSFLLWYTNLISRSAAKCSGLSKRLFGFFCVWVVCFFFNYEQKSVRN